MGRSTAAVMAWGRWIVLAVALTGCASTSFTPGSRVDNTQLLNALEADNVDFVRSTRSRRARSTRISGYRRERIPTAHR